MSRPDKIRFIGGPADRRRIRTEAEEGDIVIYWAEGVTLGYAYEIKNGKAMEILNGDVSSLPPMSLTPEVEKQIIDNLPEGPEKNRRKKKWKKQRRGNS